jgi:hypothetical protein
MRKTKHSKKGHEDASYSFVIIRRGRRPEKPSQELGRERRPMEMIGEERREVWVDRPGSEGGGEMVLEASLLDQSSTLTENTALEEANDLTDEQLTEHLRKEAYYWPKLIAPPLKRSKHIILDACTTEGEYFNLPFAISVLKLFPRSDIPPHRSSFARQAALLRCTQIHLG